MLDLLNQEGSRNADISGESADTSVPGEWQSEVARQDVIINLAGASIFQRWTGKHKKSIYDSRILTTRNLVEALPRSGKTLFISTSAVGYYGPRGDEILTEGDSPGITQPSFIRLSSIPRLAAVAVGAEPR